MKLSIIFIFSFLFLGYSQENINSNFTPFISIAAGYSLGLNDFSSDNPIKNEIDNLIGLKKNQFIFKFSGGVFYKKIGFETLLERGSTALKSDLDIFDNNINNTYNSNYFVTIQSKSDDFEIPYFRLFIGPLYRFKFSKYYITTKLLFGYTTFNIKEKFIDLKERNNNNELLLSYTNNNSTQSFLSISPRVSFSYPISKKIFINAELSYSVLDSDIIIAKKTENVFLNETISTEIVNREKFIHAIDLSFGLIYNFKL